MIISRVRAIGLGLGPNGMRLADSDSHLTDRALIETKL